MIIWHGSYKIIKNPQYGVSNRNNDYGLGFYCTESKEMAKEWACADKKNGFANCYELDTYGLNICDLSKEPYNILNWMALLVKNRVIKYSSSIGKEGAEYLIKEYLPDISGCDLVIGHRADDSYFFICKSVFKQYYFGRLPELSEAMMLGELGEQVVIRAKEHLKE